MGRCFIEVRQLGLIAYRMSFLWVQFPMVCVFAITATIPRAVIPTIYFWEREVTIIGTDGKRVGNLTGEVL